MGFGSFGQFHAHGVEAFGNDFEQALHEGVAEGGIGIAGGADFFGRKSHGGYGRERARLKVGDGFGSESRPAGGFARVEDLNLDRPRIVTLFENHIARNDQVKKPRFRAGVKEHLAGGELLFLGQRQQFAQLIRLEFAQEPVSAQVGEVGPDGFGMALGAGRDGSSVTVTRSVAKPA